MTLTIDRTLVTPHPPADVVGDALARVADAMRYLPPPIGVSGCGFWRSDWAVVEVHVTASDFDAWRLALDAGPAAAAMLGIRGRDHRFARSGRVVVFCITDPA